MIDLPEEGTVLASADLVDRIMAEDDANDPTLEIWQFLTRKSQCEDL